MYMYVVQSRSFCQSCPYPRQGRHPLIRDPFTHDRFTPLRVIWCASPYQRRYFLSKDALLRAVTLRCVWGALSYIIVAIFHDRIALHSVRGAINQERSFSTAEPPFSASGTPLLVADSPFSIATPSRRSHRLTGQWLADV